MKKILIGLGLLIVLVLILLLVNPKDGAVPVNTDINETPTDFAKIGTFVMDAPTVDEAGLPRLVYEEPGAPALIKKLVFDELSFCQAENGAIACMAMSVTYDIPFGGKRVLIEGINQANDTVLVRKLGIIRDGEPEFVPMTGFVFISWPKAQEFIRDCGVDSIFQSHDLDVKVVLKNQKEYRTVESMIDEVFKVLDEVSGKCGAVMVATE